MDCELGNGMRLPFVRVSPERGYCRLNFPEKIGINCDRLPAYIRDGMDTTEHQVRLDQTFDFCTREGADKLFEWWCVVMEWVCRTHPDIFRRFKQHAKILKMLDTRSFQATTTRRSRQQKLLDEIDGSGVSSGDASDEESLSPDHAAPVGQQTLDFDAAQVGNDLVPLSHADVMFFGDEERFHDLRIAQRLGYAHPHDIRQLIERRKAELEDVGVLIFRYGTESDGAKIAKGYWPNFEQGMLLAMFAETSESRATRREIAKLLGAFRRGETKKPDDSKQQSDVITMIMASQERQTAMVMQAVTVMTTMVGQMVGQRHMAATSPDVVDLADRYRPPVASTWHQWAVLVDGTAVGLTDVGKIVGTIIGTPISDNKVRDWIASKGGEWQLVPAGDRNVNLLSRCPVELFDCFCATADCVNSGGKGSFWRYRMACTQNGARKIAHMIASDRSSVAS